MTDLLSNPWARKISHLAIGCAMALAAPAMSWAQTAPQLDKMVVAGWSKPIT